MSNTHKKDDATCTSVVREAVKILSITWMRVKVTAANGSPRDAEHAFETNEPRKIVDESSRPDADANQ